MTTLNFAIPAWQFWASSTHPAPELSFVPPMLRRRLSPLGRAVFSVVEPLIQTQGAMPLVYVSRHGECSRTLKLLQDLAQGELMSPAAFGLSVHNANAGLYSIHKGLTQGITALSAGPHNLLAGLLEALGVVHQGQKVLCVFCDEPPPGIYHDFIREPTESFALALVLAPGSGWQLQPDTAAVCSTDWNCADNLGTPVAALGEMLAQCLNLDQKADLAQPLDKSAPITDTSRPPADLLLSSSGQPWRLSCSLT